MGLKNSKGGEEPERSSPIVGAKTKSAKAGGILGFLNVYPLRGFLEDLYHLLFSVVCLTWSSMGQSFIYDEVIIVSKCSRFRSFIISF